MALGVAFTTQCPYCIEIHSNNARQLGTTDREIAEAMLVAAALRAGGAITPRHTRHEGKLNGILACTGRHWILMHPRAWQGL